MNELKDLWDSTPDTRSWAITSGLYSQGNCPAVNRRLRFTFDESLRPPERVTVDEAGRFKKQHLRNDNTSQIPSQIRAACSWTCRLGGFLIGIRRPRMQVHARSYTAHALTRGVSPMYPPLQLIPPPTPHPRFPRYSKCGLPGQSKGAAVRSRSTARRQTTAAKERRSSWH